MALSQGSPTTNVERPDIWVVTNGNAGSDVQALGLARALGCPEPPVFHVSPGAPWRWLAPWGPTPPGDIGPAGKVLRPPWPKVLISVGRQSTAYATGVRRRANGATFTIALQDPKTGAGAFDFIWAPEHDPVEGTNVLKTLTSPHSLSDERLAAARAAAAAELADLPRPLVLLLIGGPNGAYRFGEAELERLLQLTDQAVGGGSVLVTTSRRTPDAFIPRLQRWTQGRSARLYAGEGPNPYLGWLASADAVVVTADSVNMAGEAAFTGRPVHVFHLPAGSAKFWRYHERLAETGATRPFEGRLEDWTYARVDATVAIAQAVQARLRAAGVSLSGGG